jgi:hypothetical protein
MWSSILASPLGSSTPMQPFSAKSVKHISTCHAPGRQLMARKFGGLMYLMNGHLLLVAARQASRACTGSSRYVCPKLCSTPLCQGSHLDHPRIGAPAQQQCTCMQLAAPMEIQCLDITHAANHARKPDAWVCSMPKKRACAGCRIAQYVRLGAHLGTKQQSSSEFMRNY